METDTLLKTMVDNYRHKHHEFGHTDCCQFIADYYYRATGKNYSDYFNYHSKSEAEDIEKANKNLYGVLASLLGKGKKDAEKGDIVLVLDKDGCMYTGIYNGNYCIGMTENIGLSRFELKQPYRAWHVEF